MFFRNRFNISELLYSQVYNEGIGKFCWVRTLIKKVCKPNQCLGFSGPAQIKKIQNYQYNLAVHDLPRPLKVGIQGF